MSYNVNQETKYINFEIDERIPTEIQEELKKYTIWFAQQIAILKPLTIYMKDKKYICAIDGELVDGVFWEPLSACEESYIKIATQNWSAEANVFTLSHELMHYKQWCEDEVQTEWQTSYYGNRYMKRYFLEKTINLAMQNEECRCIYSYLDSYIFCIPILLNGDLLIGTEEMNLELDGYSVWDIKYLQEVDIRDDFYSNYLKKQGIISKIEPLDIDLSNWLTIFQWLQEKNELVMINSEHRSLKKTKIWVGMIKDNRDGYVWIHEVDADGKWAKKNKKIGYTRITSISFGTKYLEVLKKYI